MTTETWFGQAEAIDALGQIIDADILRFAAILEEFLKNRNHTGHIMFHHCCVKRT